MKTKEREIKWEEPERKEVQRSLSTPLNALPEEKELLIHIFRRYKEILLMSVNLLGHFTVVVVTIYHRDLCTSRTKGEKHPAVTQWKSSIDKKENISGCRLDCLL